MTRPSTSTTTTHQLAIVEPVPATARRLMAALGDFDGIEVWEDGEQLRAGLGADHGIVVLGPGLTADETLREVARLTADCPDLVTIAVVDKPSAAFLTAALRAGVGDVCALDEAATELAPAVSRIGARVGFGLPKQERDGAPRRRGRLVVVCSAKGGVGKSVVATNLALALARAGTATALVDADLQFGDVAVMLKLKPSFTVSHAVQAGERLDSSFLTELMTAHESGLRVLPAPFDPTARDRIDVRELDPLLDVLVAEVPGFVVVDTPPQLNDLTLHLVERADEIVFVTSADLANAKNAKLGLEALRLLGIPDTRVHVVMNRAASKAKLDLAGVEQAIKARIDAFVPSSVVVPESVNKGVPVVLSAPKSDVARSIVRLAERLVEVSAAR